MTYEQIIKKYAPYLKEVTHIPTKEVEMLLLFILDKNPIWLHLHYKKECECETLLASLVKKRATYYPLEYLTSRASFYGENFIVAPNVLIPRPEAEILVEKAVAILEKIKSPKVLERDIGSGIVSVMLAKIVHDVTIDVVDINEHAIHVEKKTEQKLGVVMLIN